MYKATAAATARVPRAGPDSTPGKRRNRFLRDGSRSPKELAARRELENALALRDRILDAMDAAVLVTDPGQPDNPIVYCNAAFLAMTGYRRDEVLGRNCRFLQAADADQALALRQIHDAVGAGRPCRVTLRNRRKDGTLFWNAISVSPVPDESGAVSHFVAVQNDVSAEEERCRALERRCTDLEIIALARALELARVRSETGESPLPARVREGPRR